MYGYELWLKIKDVRTLGGQSTKNHWARTPNDLLNMNANLIHDLITMHAPIFAMYVGPTKVKEIKLKYFESFEIMFLDQAKWWGVRLTIKLYLTADVLLKVRLTRSMPLHPNKCIFLAFYVPSQIFLWEFQCPPPPPLTNWPSPQQEWLRTL